MVWSGGTYKKGNFTTNGWTGDASLGIGIEAGRHDTQDDDFAAGINQCLNKDGSNAATGNLNAGTYRITNIGAGTARTDAAQVGQVQDGTSSYLGTTAGTSTAFTVTATPTITALTTGAQYCFKANAANGVAATLKIDGTTATTMQRQGTALVGNEFKANDFVSVVYDGTNFQITNIATAPLYVDRTNNRVGIGTTAPTSALQVAGGIYGIPDVEGVHIGMSGGTAYGAIELCGVTGGLIDFNSPGVDVKGRIIYTNSDNTMSFNTNGSEKMRITGTGSMGFGTSTPTAFYEFNRFSNDNGTSLGIVNANNGSSAASVFYLGNNSSAIGSGLIYNSSANATNAGANGLTLYQGVAGGKIRVQAVSAGVELLAGATSWSAVSDERLKKNIKPLEYGLSDVLQINPVRFDYKTDESDDSKRLGFIAQELQPVIPEAVGGNEETFYGVSATELIPALIKAIKELNAKVEALEARIAALEA